MSTLDSNQVIIKLARDLGLRGLDGPVTQIADHCSRQIQELATGIQIMSLAHLEQVVAERLNLEFEEIWCDGDVERLVQKYAVTLKDPVFATIRTHFNQDTFGTTFLRKKQSPFDPDRYVAVIDCQGSKGSSPVLYPLARVRPPSHPSPERGQARQPVVHQEEPD